MLRLSESLNGLPMSLRNRTDHLASERCLFSQLTKFRLSINNQNKERKVSGAPNSQSQGIHRPSATPSPAGKSARNRLAANRNTDREYAARTPFPRVTCWS